MPPPLHSALPASSSTMSRTHARLSVEHTSPPCLPPPPSGALHVTSVCPSGEDLPPPERDRGHPSAENTLLQSDSERRLPEAGAARLRLRPPCLGPGDTLPVPPHARTAHALCPLTDASLRDSGTSRLPWSCTRSSTRTCSRTRSSLREDERVDRDLRWRAMDLQLIGARRRRAGGRGAGRPKGGPGAQGVWGRLHRRAPRAWTAGAAAQAGWGRWERRAGGAAHGCMHAVYRTCERVSV